MAEHHPPQPWSPPVHALFTNDITCIVLTEFVLKLACLHKLPAKTFLLVLASSSNIGSSATPIDNHRIAVQSRISFVKFFVSVAPAMLVGVVINVAILLCMFWNQLSPPKDDEEQGKELEAPVTEDKVISHTFSPTRMSHSLSLHLQFVPLNLQRTPANDVEKNMPQSNGVNRGCAHISGMKSYLTKNELFLKGFV
ncbi:hypothetical protein Cni_G10488 [Canna indica]|uniref:Citrate transporter-like domain-containing protein n=1 Tax=Canna indica TaxID=4628 RepID=A0AAQ3Q9Y3_9LILI|nr:hypothetical protein Cni_G10488 [Canna indica]